MKTKTTNFLIGAGIAAAILGLGYYARNIECRHLEKANNFYAQAIQSKKAGDNEKAQEYIGKGDAILSEYYSNLKYDIPFAADKAERISKKLKTLQETLNKL